MTLNTSEQNAAYVFFFFKFCMQSHINSYRVHQFAPRVRLVRHIQVVHHEQAELAEGRAVDALPAPVQLGVDEVLGLRALCLR